MRNQYGIFTAMAVASLAFMACDRNDAPTASDSAKAQEPDQSAVNATLEAGRPATPEEVKQLLSLSAKRAAGVPSKSNSGSALAKSAAVAVSCTIGFDDPNALIFLENHAAFTFVMGDPGYTEMCGNKNYWVHASSINVDHFHLAPEAADQCLPFDGSLNWGHIGSNGSCVNLSDAMYWPRKAMNMNSNTGIDFQALSQLDGAGHNFDLNALYVLEGSVKVYAYRVGIGWWHWSNLSASRRYRFANNTNISEVQVYDANMNGTYAIDNLEVSVYQ